MLPSCKIGVLILWEWLIKAIDSYFSKFNLLYRLLDVVTTLRTFNMKVLHALHALLCCHDQAMHNLGTVLSMFHILRMLWHKKYLYSYLLECFIYINYFLKLIADGTQSMVQMAFLELPLEPTKFEVDPATTGTN